MGTKTEPFQYGGGANMGVLQFGGSYSIEGPVGMTKYGYVKGIFPTEIFRHFLACIFYKNVRHRSTVAIPEV